jgi:hypothetical protein
VRLPRCVWRRAGIAHRPATNLITTRLRALSASHPTAQSMSRRVPNPLWKNYIAIQVYGANTGVGKTVFSTLLGAHLVHRKSKTRWGVNYIKPVSTGPLNEADDLQVKPRTFCGTMADLVSVMFENIPASLCIPSSNSTMQSVRTLRQETHRTL